MAWPDEFNFVLEQFLRTRTSPSSLLSEALNYAIASPGKRLRAQFALESSRICGLNPEAAKPFSISIELVHLFSLVHDDLPALDNDDLRRGLPTLHKKFNEGLALLAGDELLNLGYEAFLEISPHVEPSAFLKGLGFFNQCIGTRGMIGGQTLELELSQAGNGIPLSRLYEIQTLKTGALFRASLMIPSFLSGRIEGDPTLIKLGAYADAFGFAFQIADDLEDEEQDRASSLKNILSHLGRESAIETALERLASSEMGAHFSATALLMEILQSKR